MAEALGFASKMACTREAIIYADLWPGAPIAATQLLPFMSESLDQQPTKTTDESLDGLASVTHANVVGYRAGGPAQYQLRYQGLEFLLNAALGYQAKRISGTVCPQQLAVGAYKHRFEIDPRLAALPWALGDGFAVGELAVGQRKVRRGTLPIAKEVSVWEFLSCMVQKLTLQWTIERCSADVEWLSHSYDRASAVNTLGVMDALTSLNAPNVLLLDGVCRIGPYSTVTPLGSSHEVGLSACDVSLENALQATQNTVSGLYIEEPERSGAPKVSGTFTIPRHNNEGFLDDLDVDTTMMAHYGFTGPPIAATGINYQLHIWIPTLTFDTGRAPIAGSGAVVGTYAWTAYRPATTPAGFPANIKGGPLIIEVVSADANHPLL